MTATPTDVALARRLLQRWRTDPVAFVSDVWGDVPWSRQEEILRAVAKHPRVAVRSGHKCGKSRAFAWLAWWWTTVYHDGQVCLLAPGWQQIYEILWSEIKLLRDRAKLPVFDGCRVMMNPDKGVRWPDGRRIIGFSADTKKERVAGFSGRILYLLDEASGIPEDIHEVCSTAPSGAVAMISNPTRNEGAFHAAFHGRASVWHGIHVSSEEAAIANRELQPGLFRYPHLANQHWIDARRDEYGEDSYFYDVRVRGAFPRAGADTFIPLAYVESAAKRWHELKPDMGAPLHVGVDVARFGTDDSVMVWRRGYFCGPPERFHGLDNVQLAHAVRAYYRKVRQGNERVHVKVDGASNGVPEILAAFEDPGVEVTDVNASKKSDHPDCETMRDELWHSAREWLKSGGTLPPDDRLRADLLAPSYGHSIHGHLKVEDKKSMRKRIGRSPDAADAFALAVYDDGGGYF